MSNALASLIPIDMIPEVSTYLNLADMSMLLRSCKIYQNAYNKGIPGYLLMNGDQITQDQLRDIQFGVNRLLFHNPHLCNSLTKEEYINALTHYAKTDNKCMIQWCIAHENYEQQNTKKPILNFFKYTSLTDESNISCLANAFKGIAKGQHYTKYEDLIAAVRKGLDSVVRVLVKNCPINFKDTHGTALYVAVYQNNCAIADILLKNNANINDQDLHLQNTILHTAVQEGHVEMVRFLINAGANLTLKNFFGQTALDIAFKKFLYKDIPNKDEIIALLQKAMQDYQRKNDLMN
jgi:hypothetical protein